MFSVKNISAWGSTLLSATIGAAIPLTKGLVMGSIGYKEVGAAVLVAALGAFTDLLKEKDKTPEKNA